MFGLKLAGIATFLEFLRKKSTATAFLYLKSCSKWVYITFLTLVRF